VSKSSLVKSSFKQIPFGSEQLDLVKIIYRFYSLQVQHAGKRAAKEDF
jgi:hypothetical protein